MAAAPSACLAAGAPAAGAVGTAGMGVVPGAAGAPVPFLGDSHPGPGGPGGPPGAPPPAAPAPDAPDVPGVPDAPDVPDAPEADDAPEAPPAPDAPRPVTRRPGAGAQGGASAATLAVRGLTVRGEVPLTAAREHGIPIAFVPRQGSLVADVRLYAIAEGSRRLVVSLLVPARAASRTTVRLHVRAVRRGVYQVAVRAGAGRRTLGPAVTAGVRIV